MNRSNSIRNRLRNVRTSATVQTKLLVAFMIGSGILLAVSVMVFREVNRSLEKLDTVYLKNVELSELSEELERIHEDISEYLTTKSSDSLEDYYRHVQSYQDLLRSMDSKVTDSRMEILESNIKQMSVTFVDLSGETILAKRGRNIERYKALFAKETKYYGYIQTAIYCLNSMQFTYNSTIYRQMSKTLRYLENASLVTMGVVFVITLCIMILLIRSITEPLRRLAGYANEVASGNFEIEVEASESRDEVGIVTSAFSKMVANIRDYIEQIKQSMEKERKMKEQELLMEAHLKDAQLKYLQAQINPHFLFNCLNAGAQLAMMEDAEQTSIFIGRMADYFRYNVKKTVENATLEKELEAVDNYIYILNVRFSGEINYETRIDPEVEPFLSNVALPSMVLQPIVENALNHGIRNIDWEGKILLTVDWEEGGIRICVRDNGEGMEQERIEQILNKQISTDGSTGDHTGIGLDNVISRLELYYNRRDLFGVESEGKNQGTLVWIRIPLEREELYV